MVHARCSGRLQFGPKSPSYNTFSSFRVSAYKVKLFDCDMRGEPKRLHLEMKLMKPYRLVTDTLYALCVLLFYV